MGDAPRQPAFWMPLGVGEFWGFLMEETIHGRCKCRECHWGSICEIMGIDPPVSSNMAKPSETRIFKCQVKQKSEGFSQNVGTSQITMCPECWLWVPCRDSLNPWDFNTKSISF